MSGLLRGAAMSGAGGDWAALVGSRLCHDLVSPLGAIGNGVELLRMTLPASPELDLLADATEAAQARLRLFRLAFGAAPEGQTVDADALAQGLAALGGRIETRTDLPAPLPRRQARRLCLAALCAESALAWGGRLRIDAAGLHAQAPRLRLDAPLWEALATGHPPPDPAPAEVHFALLALDGPVGVETGETALAITL